MKKRKISNGKRLTFRQKMKIQKELENKNKSRKFQTLKHILTMVLVIIISMRKFALDILSIILFVHLAKLLWMATYKDKTKVSSKDAFYGYYTGINETLFGKGCHDNENNSAIFRPLLRIVILLSSLVYVVKSKNRSIFMKLFLFVSFLYLICSLDMFSIKGKIISEEAMYGGNLYFTIVLCILLFLEKKYAVK